MLTKLVCGLALVASTFASELTPTPSTSDATITPAPQIELLRKQNNDRYMGWVYLNGKWGPESCNVGGTYFQTSSYWRCCPTSVDGCAKNDIPIGCISGNLIYSVTRSSQSPSLLTWPCTSAFTGSLARSYTVCNSVFMFQNENDSNPLTNVNCGASSKNWSYYKVAPAAATAVTSSALVSPTADSSMVTPTSTPDPVPTPQAIPSSAPIDIETTTPKKKKSSKVWVVGAIVGALAGLAVVALGAVLALKRKKDGQGQTQTHPATGAPPPVAPVTQMHGNFPPGSNTPSQYYPPMQQHNGTPGMAPMGVYKHESWATSPSPSQGHVIPHPQGGYDVPPQQGWQSPSPGPMNQASPMYGPPGSDLHDPRLSRPISEFQPVGGYVGEKAMYTHTGQPHSHFGGELQGSPVPRQPEQPIAELK